MVDLGVMMQVAQATIVQDANKWVVTGAILVDNANTLLTQSCALSLAEQVQQVDFANVSEIDTAAISLIMEWQRRALANDRKISFVNLPDSLISLAALYGVSEFIPLSAG